MRDFEEEIALLHHFDTLPRHKPVILVSAVLEEELVELGFKIPETVGGAPVLRESQEEGGWRFPE